MTTLTDMATHVATAAHEGQTRWDNETPYITHPAAVARALIEKGFDEHYVAVAWLHDVLEDTEVTAQDLLDAGIDNHIVSAVQVLTKKTGQSYLDYIIEVKGDVLAREVKIEDIQHNMSYFGNKKKGALYAKYELALYILEEWL